MSDSFFAIRYSFVADTGSDMFLNGKGELGKQKIFFFSRLTLKPMNAILTDRPEVVGMEVYLFQVHLIFGFSVSCSS
jgi:hypothetical protein